MTRGYGAGGQVVVGLLQLILIVSLSHEAAAARRLAQFPVPVLRQPVVAVPAGPPPPPVADSVIQGLGPLLPQALQPPPPSPTTVVPVAPAAVAVPPATTTNAASAATPPTQAVAAVASPTPPVVTPLIANSVPAYPGGLSAPLYVAALRDLQAPNPTTGLYTTSTTTPEAVNAARDWTSLVAALAGAGVVQQYANGVGDAVSAANGRRLQQFPGADSPLGAAFLDDLPPAATTGEIPDEVNNIATAFRDYQVQLSPDIASSVASNLLARQVLLSRPDLASQVGPLPEVPPEGQGVVTVLANMADLANNLDSNGVDVNSFLADQTPDSQLTSLLSAANGRKLKAEGRKLQEITDIFSVIYQAQGVPSGSVEVPGATFIAPDYDIAGPLPSESETTLSPAEFAFEPLDFPPELAPGSSSAIVSDIAPGPLESELDEDSETEPLVSIPPVTLPIILQSVPAVTVPGINLGSDVARPIEDSATPLDLDSSGIGSASDLINTVPGVTSSPTPVSDVIDDDDVDSSLASSPLAQPAFARKTALSNFAALFAPPTPTAVGNVVNEVSQFAPAVGRRLRALVL